MFTLSLSFVRHGNRPEFGIEIDLHLTLSKASEGRTRVGSCHSIRQRVGTDRTDMTRERINLGNSSGRSVGMFCFWVFSNAISSLMLDLHQSGQC